MSESKNSTPVPMLPPVAPVPAQFTNEVRFAVVMYGGVSLCIYINGVAQELLEMSRVTAVDASDQLLHEPKGAGSVYRRIAQYLESDGPDEALLRTPDPTAPIRTRFVVDVLSGTSAGGLNSLFLAKALANDQDMEGLKTLWMEEGEITRLLNDNESVEGERERGLKNPTRPCSLLNSQRMYLKLLTAFDAMDFPDAKAGESQGASAEPAKSRAGWRPSPHVQDLDCYLTTTDLTGWPVEMKLDNTVATEQRHRNVFRFRYTAREERNDFVLRHNPFLAFAGRCTSAFPFAFEPMRLDDIETILSHSKRHNLTGAARSDLRKDWADLFYRDYAGDGDKFGGRAFGDGGYLDNKPFSYATRTLMRRRASLPVQRKLLYIDPSPEPKRSAEAEEWDFISNCKAALLDLPRYETIREDIQAVIDRNKLLDTVRRLTSEIDADVSTRRNLRRQAASTGQPAPKPYELRGLAERIATDGIGYGTYHRLRVIAVTMNLANLISRAAGFDPASDECQAIRWIIEHWRVANFAEEPEAGALPFGSQGDNFAADRPRSSQNSFLCAFDIDYRLRRIFFLQRRIAALSRLCPGQPTEGRDPSLTASKCPSQLEAVINDPTELKAFRVELRKIKRALSDPLHLLLGVERALVEEKRLSQMLVESLLSIDPPDDQTQEPALHRAKTKLRELLQEPATAGKFYADRARGFDAIARHVQQTFAREFANARAHLTNLLPAPATAAPLRGIDFAELLPISPEEFDDYDTVIFPIQFGTDAGEANRVDIVRISPPDAEQLISERSDKRRKLAGTAIFSFGAFLARFWRENDMLWGRLDAAEVLIRSLLQDTPAEKAVVDDLINEAQRNILSETLTVTQREELWNFICEAFAATSEARAGKPLDVEMVRNAVASLLKEFPDGGLERRLRAVLRFAGVEDDEKLRAYFRDKYEVRRSIAAVEQLRLVSRAGRVVSKMLNVLAEERTPSMEKHTALLARVATVVWGLVEISIPRTLGWQLWEDWRFRFYTTGVVLVIVGLLWQPVLIAALAFIGLTLVVDAARWRIGDLIHSTSWFRFARNVAVAVLLVLVLGLASLKAYELWQQAHGR